MPRKMRGVYKSYTPTTEKKLNSIINCNMCQIPIKYRESVSYVDGNNIAISKNSKPLCKECYLKKYR